MCVRLYICEYVIDINKILNSPHTCGPAEVLVAVMKPRITH